MSERAQIAGQVVRDLERAAKAARLPVPVRVHGPRLRVTRDHWAALAPGARRPGGTVTISGPKGKISGVPVRPEFRTRTQIVVTHAEAEALGIDAPLRDTGTCPGAGTVRVLGPRGEITVTGAVVRARRRVELSPADAAKLGVADGHDLRVRKAGPRALVFEDVLCRVAEGKTLSFHIDTDEAAAAWLKPGDTVHLV